MTALKQALFRAPKIEVQGRSADQCRIIGDIFGLQGVDDTQQLLGNMSQCHAVRLAFRPLFSIVFSKYRLKGNQRQGGIHKRVAQMRRAVFDHVAAVLRLTGLIVSWLQASKGKHLCRVLKSIDISVLRKNNRSS